jgi:hypothetical protein
MRRTLLVLAFLSSTVVLAPGRAMACTCEPFTDAEATRRSEIVFAGTLTDVGSPLLPMGGDKTVTYLFEVDWSQRTTSETGGSRGPLPSPAAPPCPPTPGGSSSWRQR